MIVSGGQQRGLAIHVYVSTQPLLLGHKIKKQLTNQQKCSPHKPLEFSRELSLANSYWYDNGFLLTTVQGLDDLGAGTQHLGRRWWALRLSLGAGTRWPESAGTLGAPRSLAPLTMSWICFSGFRWVMLEPLYVDSHTARTNVLRFLLWFRRSWALNTLRWMCSTLVLRLEASGVS